MLVWSKRVAQRCQAAWRGPIVVAALAVSCWSLAAATANAQFSGGGGVIVTVPSADDNARPTAKPKTSSKRAAKPKRRRKTAAKRSRRRPSRPRNPAANKLKIAVIVNDDPITEYEIQQRSALLAGRAGLGKRAKETFKNLIRRKSTNDRLRAILKKTIEANRGKSREQILAIFEGRKKAFAKSLHRQAVESARKSVIPGLRSKAIRELVEERLKLQAAKNAKVLVQTSRVDEVIKGIAKRNKMSFPKFKEQLRRQGSDINAMRSRIQAQMSWGRLISAKFGRFVDVNEKTIDETVGGADGDQKVKIHVHRVLFELPKKIDQRIMAQRMLQADELRGRFRDCRSTSKLARGNKGVVYKDLGYLAATKVAEPTRTLLLNSRNGEMAPPIVTPRGVALYAICGRRSGAKSFEERAAAKRKLRQKGTEIYGVKYLSDLRREAHIEYRTR